MSHVTLSIIWWFISLFLLYPVFADILNGRNRFLSRALLCAALAASTCFFGLSLDHWDSRGLKTMVNFVSIPFAISVLVALSALRNILFGKSWAHRELGRSTKSMGPFAYRETVRFENFDPEEARTRGFVKMACILLFHLVCNTIYLLHVFFGKH